MHFISRSLRYGMACLAGLFVLSVFYPQPWLYLGLPLRFDLHSSLSALFNQSSLIVAFLLLALLLSLLRIRQLKHQITLAAKARISNYHAIEAAVYEGMPFIDTQLGQCELKPIKDALNWQQQQHRALTEKLKTGQQQRQRDANRWQQSEQERRQLKLALLELKEKNLQLTQQITHLNQIYPQKIQTLQQQVDTAQRELSAELMPVLTQLAEVINELSYLQWRSAWVNQAAVLRSLQQDVECQYQTLIALFSLQHQQAALTENNILPLGQAIITPDIQRWQLVWFSQDESEAELTQIRDWGFSIRRASDVNELNALINKHQCHCVLVDLTCQGEMLETLDSELESEPLIILVSQHWSEAKIQEYLSFADGVLTSPLIRQDLLRALGCNVQTDVSEAAYQLELLLQGQLPLDADIALLATPETMLKQQVMDKQQHLTPHVTEALFELASLAEQIAQGKAIKQSADRIIGLSEDLTLPVLAVVARELRQQYQAKQDVTALCFLLWHCYQDSVRAFNARTES